MHAVAGEIDHIPQCRETHHRAGAQPQQPPICDAIGSQAVQDGTHEKPPGRRVGDVFRHYEGEAAGVGAFRQDDLRQGIDQPVAPDLGAGMASEHTRRGNIDGTGALAEHPAVIVVQRRKSRHQMLVHQRGLAQHVERAAAIDIGFRAVTA